MGEASLPVLPRVEGVLIERPSHPSLHWKAWDCGALIRAQRCTSCLHPLQVAGDWIQI